MACLGGLLLIVIGLLSIFAKDFMWELAQFSNQMKGQASERTEWWDLSTTIGGVIALLLGIAAMYIGFRG